MPELQICPHSCLGAQFILRLWTFAHFFFFLLITGFQAPLWNKSSLPEIKPTSYSGENFLPGTTSSACSALCSFPVILENSCPWVSSHRLIPRPWCALIWYHAMVTPKKQAEMFWKAMTYNKCVLGPWSFSMDSREDSRRVAAQCSPEEYVCKSLHAACCRTTPSGKACSHMVAAGAAETKWRVHKTEKK